MPGKDDLMFQCHLCDEDFPKEAALIEHYEEHGRLFEPGIWRGILVPFWCSDCGLFYGSRTGLVKHVRPERKDSKGS